MEARRRTVVDNVDDLLETFIAQHLAQNRSGGEISRLLRRELGQSWGGRSIHDITKRDVVAVVSGVEQRGAPGAANKTLKSTKTFLRWCVGRAILDGSPAEGIPLPSKVVTRDKVLSDPELAQVVLAARKMGGPYGGIVELLALTGQRREEVAQMTWDELDLGQHIWTLPKSRTKNGKQHVVHLSEQATAVLDRVQKNGPFVFSILGRRPFHDFSKAKRVLDRLSAVRQWRVHDLRRTCVNRRKWDATMSMKALTKEVNRAGKWPKPISPDTVRRAIDGLFEESGERQLQRVRKSRRPRSSVR